MHVYVGKILIVYSLCAWYSSMYEMIWSEAHVVDISIKSANNQNVTHRTDLPVREGRNSDVRQRLQVV